MPDEPQPGQGKKSSVEEPIQPHEPNQVRSPDKPVPRKPPEPAGSE